MTSRSEKASNRFLDVALQLGSSSEPIGRIAGASGSPALKQLDLPALLSLVIDAVCQAGQLLVAEWERVEGQEGTVTRQLSMSKLKNFYVSSYLVCFSATFGGRKLAIPLQDTHGAGLLTPTMARMIF